MVINAVEYINITITYINYSHRRWGIHVIKTVDQSWSEPGSLGLETDSVRPDIKTDYSDTSRIM